MRIGIRVLSSLALSACVCLGASAAHALTIYEVFPLPSTLDSWQHYSLTLAPDAWHVAATAADLGSLVSPVASVAQIQSVLGSLGSVEIGGVCTGSATAVCSFGLDNPDLAGLAMDDFSVGVSNGWRVTADRSLALGPFYSSLFGNPPPAIANQPFFTTTSLLTLLAPPKYLGNMSAAYGQTLAFDLEAQSHPSGPVSYSYGIAILSTEPVPEPSVGALIAGALCLVGWRMRRDRLVQ